MNLLANIGREAIIIYDSFTWATEVEGNEVNGIQGVPAGNKHDLNVVFRMFLTDITVHIITET